MARITLLGLRDKIRDALTFLNLEPNNIEAIETIRPLTLTSMNRIFALLDSLRYICKNNIMGSIVRCGVWQGGSMMLAALVLKKCGQVDRDIFLHDTFEGAKKAVDEYLSDASWKLILSRIDYTSRALVKTTECNFLT